jgi:hypothetical protein
MKDPLQVDSIDSLREHFKPQLVPGYLIARCVPGIKLPGDEVYHF